MTPRQSDREYQEIIKLREGLYDVFDDHEAVEEYLRSILAAERKRVFNDPRITTIKELLNERHGGQCMVNGKPWSCEVCDAVRDFQKFLEESQ